MVVPYLSGISITNDNVIYCGTFQLCWNELTAFVKEPIALIRKEDNVKDFPMVKELNKLEFTDEDLSKACYLVKSGLVKEGIIDQIKSELRSKFNESPQIKLFDNDPFNFIVFSFLLKTILFQKEFTTFNFHFKDEVVKGFGINDETDEDIRNQVRILHFNNNQDFSIQLYSKTKKDSLILAKVKPKGSLQQTIDFVEQSRREITPLGEDDILKIPNINFNLEEHFKDLIGLSFLNKVLEWYYIGDAAQLIKFSLNQAGAILRSEAAIQCFRCCHIEKEEHKEMIFDSPFLIYLKESQFKKPYFVAWINDTQYLEKIKEK